MKHAVKKHNKLMAIILALALMVSMIPMGFAFADDEAIPVVVDPAFTGNAGDLVDYSASLTGYATTSLKTYATLSAAFDGLGEAGGKIWIKGTYAVNSVADFDGTTFTTRQPVTIAGFGESTSNIITFDKDVTGDNGVKGYINHLNSVDVQKGDITFDYITVQSDEWTDNFRGAGFNSSGWKLTFGANVNGSNLRLGGTQTAKKNPDAAYNNIIDVYGGSFKVATPYLYPGGTATITSNVQYNIYGGVISNIFAGAGSANGTSFVTNKGKFEVNVYGGTVNGMYLTSYGQYAIGGTKGDIVCNVQGGYVPNVTFGTTNVMGSTTYNNDTTGNIVVIINGKKSSLTTFTANTGAAYFTKGEGKKYIAIVNNAEGGKGVVDTSNETFASLLDYNIKATNGKVEPVFEGEGVNSTLKGFKIIPDIAGYPITVDGVAPTLVEGETDVYALTAKGAEVINVNVEITYQPVVGAEGTQVGSGEKLFSTIGAAIDYLGAEGGKIYVKGTYVPKQAADMEGTMTSRGEVVIAGYGDTNEGNTVDFRRSSGGYANNDSYANLPLKGNMKFENIGLVTWINAGGGAEATDGYRGGALYSTGYLLTLGEGIKCPTATTQGKNALRIGAQPTGNNGTTKWQQQVRIESGDYTVVAPYLRQMFSQKVTVNVNAKYDIYGGNFYNVYAGTAQVGAANSIVNNGDVEINVYGGVFYNSLSVGSSNNQGAGANKGNVLVAVHEGDVSKITFDDVFCSLSDGVEKIATGNIVAVVNGSKQSSNVTTIQSSSYKSLLKGEGKIYAAIVNNAEGGKGAVNAASIPSLDYNISVTGGEAWPVYEGEGTAAVLAGFTLEGGEGLVPAIDGAPLTKAEGKDYYVLTARGAEVIDIEFIDLDAPSFIADGKYFSTLTAAMNQLGAEGGTIYVKGELTADNLAAAAAHEEIIIEGYNSNFEGNKISVTGSAEIKGDITFKNINVSLTNKFLTGAHTITFGEGSHGTLYIRGQGSGANIVIDSEYISVAEMTAFMSSGSGEYNITVNRGSFTGNPAMILGMYSNAGGNGQFNGDFNLNINGGTFGRISMAYQGTNNSGYTGNPGIKGNTIIRVNGGNINQFSFSQMGSASIVGSMHNIAVITDMQGENDKLEMLGNHIGNPMKRLDEEKSKWISIINHAESNKASHSNVLPLLNYGVKVYGGVAEPIFSEAIGGDASTSLFEGFTITPDAKNEGKLVVVNGTDVVKAGADGLYDLSAFEGTEINITFVDKKEMTSTTEELTEEELASFKASGNVPAKEGYLFSGWYESADAEKSMTADQFIAAESAVAKFIPKAVLNIGWQIAKGEADGTANLRLISTVDSLQYSGVRFTLKCEGRDDMVLNSTTVYKGIVGYVDGEQKDYAPSYFSNASQYFMTHIVSGIPTSYHDKDFTVEATLITKNGKEITGDPVKFTLKSASDYDSVMNGTNN